jgi:hypothetical protein
MVAMMGAGSVVGGALRGLSAATRAADAVADTADTATVTTESVSNFGSNIGPRLRVDVPGPGESGPAGVSVYTDPATAPLGGKYWTLPAGTELPKTVPLIDDSAAAGLGHRLLGLPEGMDTEFFQQLLRDLPWKGPFKK